MHQFSQIRERFLANARQHLLNPNATTCEFKPDCCLNTLACRVVDVSQPLGNTED